MQSRKIKAMVCAIATLTCAQVAFADTQTLTILGGYLSGPVDINNPQVDPYAEASIDGGQSWGAAYLAGGHPWGYVNGTNSWINWQLRRSADNRWWNASDPSATDANPWITDYRIRFAAPADWVAGTPAFDFVMKADNLATIYVNGAYAGQVVGSSVYNAIDFSLADSLKPGLNEIYMVVEDWGGLDGFNYRIDLALESDTGFTPLPPASSPLSKVDSDLDGFLDYEEAVLGTDPDSPDCVNAGNHGKYVSCVAHLLNGLVDLGLITEEEKDARQSIAARSSIGKPQKGKAASAKGK